MSETVVYKCPNCGAGISYDGKSEKMVCGYCDSEIEVEEFLKEKSYKEKGDRSDEFDTSFKDKEWKEEESGAFAVYTCSTCGSALITDENTSATSCVYCGNPVTISERLRGVYRPEKVIPFKTSKDDAVASLKRLYKGKPFLPRCFKDENKIKSVKGIYLPFWLFSCNTDSDITYRAERRTTWMDSRYIYTKTDRFRLYRSGRMTFLSIPADGSLKTDDTLMESIEPFNMNEAVDFDPIYLSGFFADKYDVEPESVKERIRQRIIGSISDEMARTTMGYTAVIRESSDVRYTESDVKYALLPVWMLVTEYKGKKYTFAMNGETGKSVGDLPMDWGRFWGYLAGITAGLGTVFSIISLFL